MKGMMERGIEVIDGGVTAPEGFLASTASCGIAKGKQKRLDCALLYSPIVCEAVGVFTTNRVQAAPVQWSRKVARSGRAHAVLINSGNANACTGEQGVRDVKQSAKSIAKLLSIEPSEVFVCSTGRIGRCLPLERMLQKFPRMVKNLEWRHDEEAARAIMTTDTFPKTKAYRVSHEGKSFTVGGMAKGAGMIDPNMATMLAFITTDALLERAELEKALRIAVEQSFNRIHVDGDRSTNDTVLLLANGQACTEPFRLASDMGKIFQDALNRVTFDLAQMIVRDGEETSKVVHLDVAGAKSSRDAERAARAVGGSLLVKCAWSGEDPNWGRIMSALGSSGAQFNPNRVSIDYGDIAVTRQGMGVDENHSRIKQYMRRKNIAISIDLHAGSGQYTLYTTDITPEYVVCNQSE